MDPREYDIMYRAEQSHWWYRGMTAITRRVLEMFYAPGSDLDILDAGCGTGGGLLFLSQYGSVTGLDISSHALRFCAERGCTEVARASVMALPFRDRTFDLVTSFDILYFEGIHDETALKETARVLRSGGRLLIRVPAFDWLRGMHDAKVSTAHRYTAKELAAKLEKSGFHIELLSYANMLLFPLALLKRATEKCRPAHQQDSDIAVSMGPLSGLLRTCLVLESWLIPRGRLPFGLSVIAVAKKNSLRRSSWRHMKKLESVSAFFPAYNDAATIPSMVIATLLTLPKVTDDYEVIVVNDGSPDHTADMLNELARVYPHVRIITHKRNRGYGGALRSGFASATKTWIFYTDGDAQYDPRELEILAQAVSEDCDIVNGFKIARSDPLHRILIGRLYHTIVRLLFGFRLRDVDCDFRLMRRSVFDKVTLTSTSGTICLEMVKKLQDHGFRFKEVPVHHYHRAHGKSQFFNFPRLIKTAKQLLRLWWDLVVRKVHLKNS